MRSTLIIKIILAAACIYLSFHFIYQNIKIHSALNAQYDGLSHLKNDPAKDSSENRKIYAQNKLAIQQKISDLESQRHNSWWRTLIIAFGPAIGGPLLIQSLKQLFKNPTA